MYWARANAATSDEARDRMLKEADFAFRQAFALCPYQGDTVNRFAGYLMTRQRFGDAILVVRTAGAFCPQDERFQEWVRQTVSSIERRIGAD